MVSNRDVEFNSDGTRMFVMGGAGNDINEYTLITGFDVSTATLCSIVLVYLLKIQNLLAIAFNHDGTKMFVDGLYW